MAAVDEVREAVERTVPDFSDRIGDWDAVLGKAHADGRPYRSWTKWPIAAAAAVAGAAALVLFWPVGGQGVDVLDRARATVERGPVTHVVVRRTVEVYDLERHEYRSVPDVEEEWFDPARGFHYMRTVGSRINRIFLGRSPADFSEALATAYRHALAADTASLGAEETVHGRHVYWIRFEAGPKQYDVAIDAETFEPRFVRVDGGPVASLQYETLGAGEGDFTVPRPRPREDRESSSWSGTSQIGPRTPAEARDALHNAQWLGERFGELTLASIREVGWEAPGFNGPQTVRALELCYGPSEPCAVSMTEAEEPRGGDGEPWAIQPPEGTVSLGNAPGLGYVIRDGVFVTIQARSRDELIAAAEALTRIP
jgi:hypothetical protein